MIDDRLVGSFLLAAATVGAAWWQRHRHERAVFLDDLAALSASLEPWARLVGERFVEVGFTSAEAATALHRVARAWADAEAAERVRGTG